jgi:hypothetical protein
VIDCHTHLGWSQMLAPQVDLLHRAPRTQYLLDCDREPPCALDLDVHVNANFTDAMHRDLSHEVLRSVSIGGGAAATYTIPNLVAEMDLAGVAKAAVLPIAAGLPFDSDATLDTGGRGVQGGDSADVREGMLRYYKQPHAAKRRKSRSSRLSTSGVASLGGADGGAYGMRQRSARVFRSRVVLGTCGPALPSGVSARLRSLIEPVDRRVRRSASSLAPGR